MKDAAKQGAFYTLCAALGTGVWHGTAGATKAAYRAFKNRGSKEGSKSKKAS